MLLSTVLRVRDTKYLIRISVRDMYGNSHSEGTCVLLEIPSTHKLVQNFQSLHVYGNGDIYELKGVRIANFEVDLFSSSLEYCSLVYTHSVILVI